MERILITGGAGFIGSSLALALLEKGCEVRVLDNLNPQVHGNTGSSYLYNLIKGKAECIIGDVRNVSDITKALRGADVVIHLAAETGTGQSMYEIVRYVETNDVGTATLLDHIVNTKNKVRKLIIASSRAVYGEGKYKCDIHGIVYPRNRLKKNLLAGKFECLCPICGKDIKVLPTDEESKIQPNSIYGLTKYQQEAMAILTGNAVGLPVVAFRMQNVYGPGQSLSNVYTGILSIFSSLIRSGTSLNIFEDGQESRDFIYLSDIVEAFLLAIDDIADQSQIYNLGSGVPINIKEVAQTLTAGFLSNIDCIVTGLFRLGDIRHIYADTDKIKKILGFAPKISFKEGIGNYIKWVNEQNNLIDTAAFPKSIQEMQRKNLLFKASSLKSE